MPLLTLAIAIAAVVVAAVPSAAESLQFSRTHPSIARALTSHLSHWSSDHLFWDLLAFIVLGVICERRGRWRFAITLILAALAIPFAALKLMPELHSYRGLSGIDSALFALAAVGVIRDAVAERDRWIVFAVGAIVVGFFAKVIVEIVSGSTVFVDSTAAGFVPVPMAHLLGATIGGAIGSIRSSSRTAASALAPAARAADTRGCISHA